MLLLSLANCNTLETWKATPQYLKMGNKTNFFRPNHIQKLFLVSKHNPNSWKLRVLKGGKNNIIHRVMSMNLPGK